MVVTSGEVQAISELTIDRGQSLSIDSFVTRLGTIGGIDLVAELERLAAISVDREAVERGRWERKMELVREAEAAPWRPRPHRGGSASRLCGRRCEYAVTQQLDLSEADVVVESLDDLALSDVLRSATVH
ncbi:MAG: hypothetical protein ACRDG2_05430 [Actinomycetota bacterium]